jgi:hypothetical protein
VESGPAEDRHRRSRHGEAVPVGALNELARRPVEVLSLADGERSAFAHSYSANGPALTGTRRPHVTAPKTANPLLVRMEGPNLAPDPVLAANRRRVTALD